jgi:xylulokinase
MAEKSRNLWLAFDIGTTGLKAALVAPDGEIVRSAYAGYATHTADGGIMEQEAADWWKAAVEACKELSKSDDIKRVEAVAITGQMQDLILVDDKGNPVHPVILYSDSRAITEADGIVRRIGVERLRSLTGNDQDAGGLLAKLLWLKLNQPKALESAKHLLLGAADFLAMKMTGVATTDTTTASTTGLMDMGARAVLSHAVLEEIGVGESHRLLPTISAGGSKTGVLTEAAAKELGLKAGTSVHHGPGDAGATTLGAGSGEAGPVYGYLGTSGWIAFTSPGRASPDQGAITLAHPKQTYYIQVAPLLTAGRNLEWVRDLFGSDDYDKLIEKALAAAPSNLLYLPYLNGERSPFRDPFARGAFVGLNSRTSKVDLYRAVLEGVVFGYRHALNSLLVLPATTLMLTGGGTKSVAWCQLFADIVNVPVAVAADAENVGVRGAVLAAQVALGEVNTYNPPGYFPVKMTLQPNPANRAHFDAKYQLFRDTYPALKPIFGKMG